MFWVLQTLNYVPKMRKDITYENETCTADILRHRIGIRVCIRIRIHKNFFYTDPPFHASSVAGPGFDFCGVGGGERGQVFPSLLCI